MRWCVMRALFDHGYPRITPLTHRRGPAVQPFLHPQDWGAGEQRLSEPILADAGPRALRAGASTANHRRGTGEGTWAGPRLPEPDPARLSQARVDQWNRFGRRSAPRMAFAHAAGTNGVCSDQYAVA